LGLTPESWVLVLGYVGAVFAFCLGIRQYSEAQIWNRTQFVTTLINEFNSQENVKVAKLMLDWNDRKIRLLKSQDEIDEIHFENQMLIHALKVHDKTTKFEKYEEEIRDAFGDFF
jgi:hypothetical protein